MRDWQKGGLGGFIIGFLYVLYAINEVGKEAIASDFILLSFFAVVLPTSYGSLNGFIFSKVKTEKTMKKWGSLFISVILSALLFFLLWFILIASIAKSA